ncbi:MAG: response regulator [Micropepsaceae bacterium]
MLQELLGADNAEPPALRPKNSLEGRRILVVDDNAINLEVAAETLLSRGAVVDTAAGGNEALGSIDRAAYDLVLLDLTMPDVDGIAVGKAIRASKLNANVAVLLFTAADDDDARQASLEVGAVGYVSKPVDIDALLDLVWTHSTNPNE